MSENIIIFEDKNYKYTVNIYPTIKIYGIDAIDAISKKSGFCVSWIIWQPDEKEWYVRHHNYSSYVEDMKLYINFIKKLKPLDKYEFKLTKSNKLIFTKKSE